LNNDISLSELYPAERLCYSEDLDCGILSLAAVYGLTDIGNGCKIFLKLKPLNF
jgi:hypothetical protein